MQIIINQLIQFCDGMILFVYYFNDSKSIIWYITFLRTEINLNELEWISHYLTIIWILTSIRISLVDVVT